MFWQNNLIIKRWICHTFLTLMLDINTIQSIIVSIPKVSYNKKKIELFTF